MLLAEGEAGLGSWTGKGAQAVFFLQTGITAPVDDLETAIFVSASQLSKKRDVCRLLVIGAFSHSCYCFCQIACPVLHFLGLGLINNCACKSFPDFLRQILC